MNKLVYSLAKIAGVATKLQPHQQRVVDRIQQPDQPGLVVAHGLGSGKTLTSIAAQEALGKPSDVVVPASLQANYQKERKKHLSGKKNQTAHIQSMQNITRKKTPPARPVMIVDEAHRARESGTQTYKTLAKNEAEKRLLLTGSPFYNRPSDIAPLVDLAAGTNVLPTSPEQFNQKYVRQRNVSPGFLNRLRGIKPGVVEELNPAHKQELQGVLNKWVDYHPSSKEDFPEVQREDVKVPMDPRQLEVYDTMLKKAPPWVAAKIRSRMPPSKRESQQLNAFLSGTRQIANSTAPFQEGVKKVYEPKIDEAFTRLQQELASNPRSKAVVYSNYLDAGVNPYAQRLQAANIPYGEFTGEMNKVQRDELVKSYNQDKLRALLLSSAGGEGLDLKGTRLVQMLEPHWNDEKLRQVEGRGIRYKSHSHLPAEERNVKVQRFLATRRPTGILERLRLKKPGGSVDEYLAARAADKENLIQQFRALLEQRQLSEAQ
jgi:SNF2 family DNA or RNA helicase